MGANNKILSCRPCRERKVRCDRMTPCKSCVRHGCETRCQPYQPACWTYQDKLPITRANKSVRRAQSISTAIDTCTGRPTTTQLLASVSSLSTYHSVPSNANSEQRQCNLDTNPQQRYITSNSTGDGVSSNYDPAALSVEALRTHNDLRCLYEDEGSQAAITAPSFSGSGVTLSTSEKTNWQLYLASCLPPRSQCDLFVAYFFESTNWIYQAIHAPSFRQKYEIFWRTPVKDIDLVWLALLYVMISLTALYIDPRTCESVGFDASNVRDSGHLWFRLSRQALHAGEYESRPCLTQLQVFIESQLYWYATKAVESLNSALGQAIRCAQAIGLDKDRTPAADLASELRHRIWWDLCCSDTFQSLCLDRQTLVQAHLSDVPMPQNCDDSDITQSTINPRPIEDPTVMSMHVLRAHLFKTFNKLYADNGAALASYEEVSSIDGNIIAIVNQFPWYFKSAPGNAIVSPTLPPAYDYIQWQHHLIHNSICVQRIRMYRPFLRTSYHNACWSKCIEAVEEAFAVYHAIRAANPARFQRSQRMLAQSYQIFCSAVSIAVFLLVERPVVPSRMQSDIEVVIQDLQKLVQNHSSTPMAVAGRDVLTKILHAYNNGDGLQAHHNAQDGAPSSNWHSLIPEIYAYMGGKRKTKTYLERCAVSHIVNQESSITAAQASPVTHSQAGTTATPPDVVQATQGSIDMIYPTSADATISNDPVPSFGFDLHFDVLNWGAEDFPFLQ